MFDWIQTNSASINVIATIVLVSVTAFYAYLTWRILRNDRGQVFTYSINNSKIQECHAHYV